MTKIKNPDAYPFKIPVPNDFVPGSDSENNGETVSFKFQDIVGLINSINGNEAVSYIFAESPILQLDENGSGYFLSENNEINPANVTSLIVSKETRTKIDLTVLFNFINDHKDGFILKLRNVSDPNNFIYFEILNIIEDTYQFTLAVSLYESDYFEGTLVYNSTYDFGFNIKTGESPDNYTKIVYVNTTSPSIATIFDINNPPLINDNALKNDVNNLYIGNDASTWVYITSPPGYITKTVSATMSNFFLSGTTTDAGTSKSAPIERTGTVGGAPATASNHFVPKAQADSLYTSMTFNQSRWQFSDFTNPSANQQGPFIGAALASGSIGLNTSTTDLDLNSLGAILLQCSTSANSGYRSSDAGGVAMPSRSGMTFLGRFGISSDSSGRDRIIRIGFHNSINQIAPTNGVYLEILGVSATFKATSSSVSTSSTSVNLNDSTTANGMFYYSIFITYTANRVARCVLYDSAMVVVLSRTFTTSDNTPITGSRVNSGIIATITTAGAVANICQIDYMGVGIEKPSFLNSF